MIQLQNNRFGRMKTQASAEEVEAYTALARLFRTSPIPADELLGNLSLYMTRSLLSQVLFLSEMYRRILDVHGAVVEFGNRWGRNLALFSTLRNVFEPHNYNRKIVGFDTFDGFPNVAETDGGDPAARVGALSVTENYQAYLDALLEAHQRLAPRPELRRFETVKGDVEETVPRFLAEHPETIIALAYFDMDLYRPTKAALQAIAPCLTKGSVVGFDELGLEEFPGETAALKEVLGLSRHALKRSAFSNHQSYIVID
jgi:hypothetical protein